MLPRRTDGNIRGSRSTLIHTNFLSLSASFHYPPLPPNKSSTSSGLFLSESARCNQLIIQPIAPPVSKGCLRSHMKREVTRVHQPSITCCSGNSKNGKALFPGRPRILISDPGQVGHPQNGLNPLETQIVSRGGTGKHHFQSKGQSCCAGAHKRPGPSSQKSP